MIPGNQRFSFHGTMHLIRNHSQRLNVFPSVPPTTDQNQLRNQIISTRLFIVSLLFALIILIIYNSSVTHMETIIHSHPPLQQYQQLYEKHRSSLICPCTQIAMKHDKFLEVRYVLHQVCSSGFVGERWVNYLQEIRSYRMYKFNDFRETSFFTFKALASLCTLANETLTDAITRFYSNHYATFDLVSDDVFRTQTELLTEELRKTTIGEFSISLQIVENITQVNAFWSSLRSNAVAFFLSREIYANWISHNFGQCSCAMSSWCSRPSSIYDDTSSNGTVSLFVPGMYIGCYILESLLQSTLECFHDQSCFDILTSTMSASIQPNVTLLQAEVNVNFTTTSTVGDMLNKLMVDKWIVNTRYENYYAECRPSECRYTVMTRNGAICIVTAIVGLIGGLVTALKLIVPLFVRLIRKKKSEHGDVEGKGFIISR